MIEELASQPVTGAAQELRGLASVYRLHLNGWRIIYQVDEDLGTVCILGVRQKIGPETYEALGMN